MALRCIVCGKELKEGEKAVSFDRGEYKIDKNLTHDALRFEAVKRIGVSHEPCFEQAVSSPQIVMSRIKKLSKIAKK